MFSTVYAIISMERRKKCDTHTMKMPTRANCEWMCTRLDFHLCILSMNWPNLLIDHQMLAARLYRHFFERHRQWKWTRNKLNNTPNEMKKLCNYCEMNSIDADSLLFRQLVTMSLKYLQLFCQCVVKRIDRFGRLVPEHMILSDARSLWVSAHLQTMTMAALCTFCDYILNYLNFQDAQLNMNALETMSFVMFTVDIQRNL